MAVLSNMCTIFRAMCLGVFPRLVVAENKITVIEASLPLPNPLPIAKGGTGAQTSIAARASLSIDTIVLSAGQLNISMLSSYSYSESLTVDKAFTFSDLTNNLGASVVVKNPLGSLTATFPAYIKWPNDVTPDPPSTGMMKLYTFTVAGGIVWGAALDESTI